MDQQRLNAFIVAKGLFERGAAAADGTAPGAMAAVILLDLAVESAAKAAFAVHRPTSFPGVGYATRTGDLPQILGARDPSLPQVLDALQASHRERLGDDQAELDGLREARKLHGVRNTVQHEAAVPSADEVDRSRLRANDVLHALLRAFFGMELSQVSRATLVRDPQVRAHIQSAEREFDDGHLTAAIGELSIAFEMARYAFRAGEPIKSSADVRRSDVRRAVVKFTRRARPSTTAVKRFGEKLKGLGLSQQDVRALTSHMVGDDDTDTRELERVLERLARRLDRLDDRVEALSMAADPGEYAWFRQLVPPPAAMSGDMGPEWMVPPPRRAVSTSDYSRAIDFVTTVALRWQELPAEGLGVLDDDLGIEVHRSLAAFATSPFGAGSIQRVPRRRVTDARLC